MIYKIIGLEHFTSKSGKQITKIHAIYEKNVISGYGVELFFIMSDDCPEDICLDAKFKALYGRRGSQGFLSSIEIQ